MHNDGGPALAGALPCYAAQGSVNENAASTAYWRAGIKLASVILNGHSLSDRQILSSEAASSQAINPGVVADAIIGRGLTEWVRVRAGVGINQHGPKRVLKVQGGDYALLVEAARSCGTFAPRNKEEQRGQCGEADGTHLNHRRGHLRCAVGRRRTSDCPSPHLERPL
jgi:hypothetical protein